MLQAAVNFNLALEHVQTSALELLKVNHLHCHSLMLLVYLAPLIDMTAVAPPQLVASVVLVATYAHLSLLQPPHLVTREGAE